MNFSNRYNTHLGTKCEFMRWLNAERQHFRGVHSAAQIAVWRPRENLAMSGRLAYAATMRMEQLLIETRRGFDFVFHESPAALVDYQLVVVPSIECMNVDQIAGLLDYVRNGGSLFVGQESALFDLWHRRRVENPWHALFGDVSARGVVADAIADGVAGLFTGAQSAVSCDQVAQVSYGKGRAVYAPIVVDPASQPSLMTIHGGLNCDLDYTNWAPPKQADEFNRAIEWLTCGSERFKVSAGRGMLAEFLSQDDSARHLIHLVNLRPEPETACVLEVRGADHTRCAQVLVPPTDLTPKWREESTKDGLSVTFDLLDTYAVVVLDNVAAGTRTRW